MVIQCSVVWKCQATEPDYQPRLHSCMYYRLDKPDCLIKLFFDVFFELIIFECFNLFNLIRLRFFLFARKSEHFLWHWERFLFWCDIILIFLNRKFPLLNFKCSADLFFPRLFEPEFISFRYLMTDCHDFRLLSISIKIGNYSKFIGMNVASEMYRSR